MITRQEYENAKQIIAKYELQIKEQDEKIKFANYIKTTNLKVVEVIEEIKKLGFSTWGDERVRKYDDDLDYIAYIRNGFVLEIFFNREKILINLWCDNIANKIGAEEIYTVTDVNSAIEILKDIIDKINYQWLELKPIMEKYEIKEWVEE